jgi:hypothetical protein
MIVHINWGKDWAQDQRETNAMYYILDYIGSSSNDSEWIYGEHQRLTENTKNKCICKYKVIDEEIQKILA